MVNCKIVNCQIVKLIMECAIDIAIKTETRLHVRTVRCYVKPYPIYTPAGISLPQGVHTGHHVIIGAVEEIRRARRRIPHDAALLQRYVESRCLRARLVHTFARHGVAQPRLNLIHRVPFFSYPLLVTRQQRFLEKILLSQAEHICLARPHDQHRYRTGNARKVRRHTGIIRTGNIIRSAAGIQSRYMPRVLFLLFQEPHRPQSRSGSLRVTHYPQRNSTIVRVRRRPRLLKNVRLRPDHLAHAVHLVSVMRKQIRHSA